VCEEEREGKTKIQKSKTKKKQNQKNKTKKKIDSLVRVDFGALSFFLLLSLSSSSPRINACLVV